MFADETAKGPSINDIVSGGRVGGHTVGQIRPKCEKLQTLCDFHRQTIYLTIILYNSKLQKQMFN